MGIRNTAYALLASIIERVSKKGYGEFLAENIFNPLYLKRTQVYNTRRSSAETIPTTLFGYVYSDSLKKFPSSRQREATSFRLYP